MSSNYQKQFQKDYENLVFEVADSKKLIKNLTSTIKVLNETIVNMNTSIEKIVTYGNELKAVSMLLVHRVPASMDQVVDFMKLITDGVFNLTKGTIANWSNSLSAKLDGFIGEIFQGLHNSVYVHTDESPIN